MTTGPVYVYRGDIIRVVDGDTLDVRIDLGFRAALRVSIRVRDLRCPERRTPEGLKVWAAAVDLGNDISGKVLVQSFKDDRSFERWVADVWVPGPDDAWVPWADALRQRITWTDPGL